MIEEFEITKDTEGLRKLILENPSLPIVILCDGDLAMDEYAWVYAPSINYRIDEILTCRVPFYEDKVFNDRIEFEERLADWLDDQIQGYIPEEEFNECLAAELAKYEPYWKKVIAIFAGT